MDGEEINHEGHEEHEEEGEHAENDQKPNTKYQGMTNEQFRIEIGSF